MWYMPCSAKMDAREKDSGRWLDMWCLLLTFLSSSSWWWLISSMFLTRTSCLKTTHANGYYGAWPWWAGFSQYASPNNHTCLSPPHFWLKTNKSRYPYLLCDHLEGWRHTTFNKNCKAKHGVADDFSNGNSDCLFSWSCKHTPIKPSKTGRKKKKTTNHNVVNNSNKSPLCLGLFKHMLFYCGLAQPGASTLCFLLTAFYFFENSLNSFPGLLSKILIII